MIAMDGTTRYAMRYVMQAVFMTHRKKWPRLPIIQLPFDTSFVLRLSASAVAQLLEPVRVMADHERQDVCS